MCVFKFKFNIYNSPIGTDKNALHLLNHQGQTENTGFPDQV